jgi:hypothetical protein
MRHVMAAGPFYIALAGTAQKTLLPIVLLLLGDFTIRADFIENANPLLRVQSLLR